VFLWKEPWKKALQDWGRFTALGEAARSLAAVPAPTALVRVSVARTVCTLRGLGKIMSAHRAFPAKFTRLVSGNWLCWQRA